MATATDPNARFGELRALLQHLDGSPAQALAFFDAHALGAPVHARDVWLPYAIEHLGREAEGLDESEGIPLSCAVASLTRWVGHDALAPATIPDGLVLLSDPEPFAPFTFCASLLELFWRHGSFELMRTSRLPEELMSYLVAAQGRWWSRDRNDPYARSLNGELSILQETAYELENWSDEREDAGAPAPGAWISIGNWSDRHITLLCCDTTSERFGGVFDFNDGHPWLNGERAGYREAESFMEYVGSLVG